MCSTQECAFAVMNQCCRNFTACVTSSSFTSHSQSLDFLIPIWERWSSHKYKTKRSALGLIAPFTSAVQSYHLFLGVWALAVALGKGKLGSKSCYDLVLTPPHSHWKTPFPVLPLFQAQTDMEYPVASDCQEGCSWLWGRKIAAWTALLLEWDKDSGILQEIPGTVGLHSVKEEMCRVWRVCGAPRETRTSVFPTFC